ncbi:MAG: hypothetical protein MnENMB40S_18190 [Rhizobiaceae bacterium MnEN-MB40S]|nr:MAG: hypothetical protein MnENMB40S_18190 [Rhizobiaceae bacterium MnEN-MB40S]
MMSKTVWSWGLAIVGVVILLFFTINLFSQPSVRVFQNVAYSEFVDMVRGGEILRVTLHDRIIEAEGARGVAVVTQVPVSDVPGGLLSELLDKEVMISVANDDPGLLSLVLAWMPVVIFYVGLWLLFTRPTLQLLRKVDARMDALEGQVERSRNARD